MTINLAIEYIPRRMQELGYGDKYIIRFRHFVLTPNQQITIRSFGGEFYLLVRENETIRIDSEAGLYDKADTKTNELMYEHHGEITVLNKAASLNYVKMVQVIPKHKNSK